MGLLTILFAAVLIVWIINRWRSRAYLKLAYMAPSNKWTTLLGCGKLVGPKEPMWSQHRKLLNKAFNNKNMVSFLPDFHTEITQFIEEVEKSVDQGEPLDMLVVLRVLGLTNATKTILKRNLEKTDCNSSAMAIHFEHVLHFGIDMCLYRFLTINWLRKLAEISIYKSAAKGLQMILKLLDESISMAQQNDVTDPSYLPNKNSVLDYVIDGSQQYAVKEDDRHGVLANFFVAAFETTSTTMNFALFLLAMHPEYQERAYEGVSKVLNDDNTELSINQLDELVYLDMVFNETMRVLPIVPIVFRKVSKEDVTLSNGWTLPIGQIICVDIISLHRSEELWGPEAKKFNPDNFLPSNAAGRHPYSFIPFTKGQRFCIGWRYSTLFFKMTLAKIIAKFKLSTDFKYEDLRFENHITLKLIEEPRVHLERRKA